MIGERGEVPDTLDPTTMPNMFRRIVGPSLSQRLAFWLMRGVLATIIGDFGRGSFVDMGVPGIRSPLRIGSFSSSIGSYFFSSSFTGIAGG